MTLRDLNAELVANAYIQLGTWKEVYRALVPNCSASELESGAGRLAKRIDVRAKLDELRTKRIYARKTRDDLLRELDRVIKVSDKGGEVIQAVKAYADLAGYTKEEKRQDIIPVIALSKEDFKVLSDGRADTEPDKG